MSTINHIKQSVLPDGANAQLIQPSDWNDEHTFSPAIVGFLLDKTGSNNFTGVNATAILQTLRRNNNPASNDYEFVTSSEVFALDYQFTNHPVGNLSAAVGQVITLSPMPIGISPTYSPLRHYIRIIDGISGNETCLIQSATATTITVNCTLPHTSGNYTVTSATMGIQEALYSPSLSVQCYGPGGVNWQIYQTIFMPGGRTLIFDMSTIIMRMFSDTNPLIKLEGGIPGGVEWGGGIFNLFTACAVAINPLGYTIEIRDTANTVIQNVYCKTVGSGIKIIDSTIITVNCFKIEFFSGVGFSASGPTLFTCDQYMARTNDNGAIFYLPGGFGTSGQFNNFMWQGGPLFAPDTRGIAIQNGNIFSETIFNNGIVDSLPRFLDYQPGVLQSNNCKFSNIGYFGGQLSGAGNVNTAGTAVTWVSGTQFLGLRAGDAFRISGVNYIVANTATATTVTLTTSAGNQTNVSASFNRPAIFAVIGAIANNITFDNIDLYGSSHSNGIIIIQGGNHLGFNAVRIHDTFASANGSRGFEVAGLVKDLSIINCSSGYGSIGQDQQMANGIVIGNFAHERILINGCQLFGTVNNFVSVGDNSYLRLGYNVGIDEGFGTITAAASITITHHPVQFINGTTVISTILGGWIGRKVTFLFSSPSPGGFGVGGNIVNVRSTIQHGSITMTFINGTTWY